MYNLTFLLLFGQPSWLSTYLSMQITTLSLPSYPFIYLSIYLTIFLFDLSYRDICLQLFLPFNCTIINPRDSGDGVLLGEVEDILRTLLKIIILRKKKLKNPTIFALYFANPFCKIF